MKSPISSSEESENEAFGKEDFLIVGLGASAGGIQALKEFFENVPADSDMAYVVILHLSPDHDSQLAAVLQQDSAIPVAQVIEKVQVKPNHVYVVPPNRHLMMEDVSIIVSPNINPEDRRAPVDIFFRTLAETHGPRAVCVVLSGTGANGSMGLKRVKECGGAAFVQTPREAEFDEMPRNSIATDLVDEVLPVAAIPAKIMAYKLGLDTVQISIEAERRPQDQQQALRDVFSQLRLRTGHDFSNYKRPTLLRRIERRISIRNLPDLPAYAVFIQQNPDETTALLKDLLISVTNFFRDKRAWDIIEQDVLPRILSEKTSDNQVRIWVAGCATGEEAYSIAMLCAEKTLGFLDAPKVHIFATDIDEAAISHAREGFYTLNDAADVSTERLRRFFNKEGDGYRIRREIRETIMFAHHNFLKDPPFSHLDLISCRNVLIYLNRIAQERVAETFHFALDPGGYLFLGSSEAVDGATDLYSVFNRENHIFQARVVNTRFYPVPDSIPTFRKEQLKIAIPLQETEKRDRERISYGDLHQQLLEQYAPPSIVINREHDIVHLTEQAGRYMQISGGEPSQNLLKLIRPELRLELRSVLFQAMEQQTAVKSRALKVTVAERVEIIHIHIRPVFRREDSVQGFILVLFEPAKTDGTQPDEPILTANEPAARHLEEELTRMKAQLRATIEQYEFQGEELKASNEELQAMNEELRSAAEELETSKEELQSINEEMQTVNQELKIKIEETSLTSNNLQNLMNSANIATIFLDRSFRVALFTPAIREIFNLIPSDYGRPITDITNRLQNADLLKDAEVVLEKLHVVEREVFTTNGRLYMMRLLPYRTNEDRINGIVITFFDITRRKQAEEALLKSQERQSFLLKLSDAMQSLKHPDEVLVKTCRLLAEHLRAERTYYGVVYEKEDRVVIRSDYFRNGLTGLAGQYALADLIETPQMLQADQPFFINDAENLPSLPEKIRHFYQKFKIRSLVSVPIIKDNKFVKTLNVASTAAREWTQDEKSIIQEVAERTWTVLEHVHAQEALRISEERYRIALKSAEMAAWDWDIVNDRVVWNDQHYLLLGMIPSDTEKSNDLFLKFIHPEDLERVNAALRSAIRETGIYQEEFRIIRADDKQLRWMSGYGRAVTKENGVATRLVGVMQDITRRKLLEQQQEDFISIASHELRTPVTSVKAYAELLRDIFEESGDKANEELVHKLDTQVDRLAELIRDLLDSTKISEKQLPLSLNMFNLGELIQECVEEFKPLSPSHQFVIQSCNAIINADRERIKQVLDNLISNAIKYSPGGGGVFLTCHLEVDGVMVSVRDEGIGIPTDLQDKIFDRFFRIRHVDKRSFPGIGLGLYITAGIIHHHGGSIRVESQPDRGTIFYFKLPYNAMIRENERKDI